VRLNTIRAKNEKPSQHFPKILYLKSCSATLEIEPHSHGFLLVRKSDLKPYANGHNILSLDPWICNQPFFPDIRVICII